LSLSEHTALLPLQQVPEFNVLFELLVKNCPQYCSYEFPLIEQAL
jgi:hypothetical protein